MDALAEFLAQGGSKDGRFEVLWREPKPERNGSLRWVEDDWSEDADAEYQESAFDKTGEEPEGFRRAGSLQVREACELLAAAEAERSPFLRVLAPEDAVGPIRSVIRHCVERADSEDHLVLIESVWADATSSAKASSWRLCERTSHWDGEDRSWRERTFKDASSLADFLEAEYKAENLPASVLRDLRADGTLKTQAISGKPPAGRHGFAIEEIADHPSPSFRSVWTLACRSSDGELHDRTFKSVLDAWRDVQAGGAMGAELGNRWAIGFGSQEIAFGHVEHSGFDRSEEPIGPRAASYGMEDLVRLIAAERAVPIRHGLPSMPPSQDDRGSLAAALASLEKSAVAASGKVPPLLRAVKSAIQEGGAPPKIDVLAAAFRQGAEAVGDPEVSKAAESWIEVLSAGKHQENTKQRRAGAAGRKEPLS